MTKNGERNLLAAWDGELENSGSAGADKTAVTTHHLTKAGG